MVTPMGAETAPIIKLPTTIDDTIGWWEYLYREAGEQHVDYVSSWLGRQDLFFLLVVLCKRIDLNRDWLFDRIRMVQDEPNGCIDLWAREHGKSSIITFGQ